MSENKFTEEFLKQHGACNDGARWALSIGEEMADVWDAMIAEEKHEWLLWTATRPNVFTDSVLRKLACRFVRETPLHDGRTVWALLEDNRSRRAVEVSEAYADGKATYEELKTARATARAAARAADRAVAGTAAFAAYTAAFAAFAAYAADAAYAAARAAARDAAYAAEAADAADAAYDAAYDAANAAQAQMIADLGNPFKKGQEDE